MTSLQPPSQARPTPFAAAARPCALALAGLLAASGAAAVPAPYAFDTGTNPYGTVGVAGLFDPGSHVQGQFMFDAQIASTGTASNGATLYSGSLLALSGSVQGHAFSDPGGYTAVGNDLASAGNNDYLQIGAEPSLGTGTHDLLGFVLPGYTLVNVRLFWIEGQLGIGDFLGSAALPSQPPAFLGRLALDFVADGSPSGPLNFVFFDGVQVSAVPEPPLPALWGAGALVLLAALRRRRGAQG